ncbi:GbsR/MarR family transcriptional regulator [Hazenella coriacea]|uniref:HTH-type transcriptional regulator n=1 Tax=Hazenella coriacea TaxID=1179467 RepID=A0A4R3LC30_9BACL|nr:MarR family transcriptional regulator [Hazenella coriacea]TCS95874.1 winged helix DNA-binding protein [Hazenella coriacea]
MENTEWELNEEKQSFIEKLGIYYESYGIPRIGGRILGLMLVSYQPVSAEQISKFLQVSRGSISTNVRLLVSNGLLEKTSKAGDRTDYYTISESIWDHAIKVRIDGFKHLKQIVAHGVKTVEEDAVTNKHLPDMHRWINKMIDSHEKALVEWRKEMED